MKTLLQRSLLLSVLLALGACRSPEGKEAPSSAESSVQCICGTPEAAFDGCPHPKCLSGEGNPDNPDCVCGPLTLQGGKAQ